MVDFNETLIVRSNGRGQEEPAKLVATGVNPFAAEALHLREILGILRRHSLVVLLVMFVMVGGAGLWLWARPRLFQATSAVLIVDAQRSLAGAILDEPAGRGVGRLTDPIRSHMQVLQGRAVLGRAVDREGLRLVSNSPGFPRHLLSASAIPDTVNVATIELDFSAQDVTARTAAATVRARYGEALRIGGVAFTIDAAPPVSNAVLRVLPRESAIDRLYDKLRVLPRPGTDVIDISYTSTDPIDAQRIVNTVATAFQHYNQQMVQQQTKLRRDFLENQLRTTEADLIAANQALNNFRQSRQIYRPTEQLNAQQQALMSLDIQRSQIEADRRMYRSLLDALQPSATGPRSNALRTLVSSPGIANNPVISQLYAQLVAHEKARDELTTGPLGSTAADPDVQRLNQLITATEDKLIDASRSHVASLDARLAALDSLRAGSLAAMRVLPVAETEEARLLQDIRTIGSVADAIRADLQKARMAEAIETGQVEILNLAAPGQPLHAARRKRFILASILGLMFGGGTAFLIEFMDSTIRRRREVEEILQLGCLAVIPPVQSRNGVHRLNRLGSLRWMSKRKARGAPPLMMRTGPNGTAAAEAFRRVRNKLLLPGGAETLRTLLITSPSAGEGKTFTSANLAVTISRQGKQVLVVDADLHRPQLHEVFQVPREPGFAEVLLGQVELFPSIKRTLVEKVSVLPAGARVPPEWELTQGAALDAVISQALEKFDIVILDTPPVLATADVMALASLSGRVLLVLKAGATRPDTAQQAIEELNRIGAHIVGAVLVDPDRKVLEDSYSYEDYVASGA